jgi:hypothetical protein
MGYHASRRIGVATCLIGIRFAGTGSPAHFALQLNVMLKSPGIPFGHSAI